MRILRIFLAVFVLTITTQAFSANDKAVDSPNIINLKSDLVNGKIVLGKTSLADIRHLYGESAAIDYTDKTVIYNYGDLKIEFEKNRYLRHWEYDSFKKPVYTTNINNLRKDLESKKIEGDLITYEKIKKDYGVPTESQVSENDGEMSIYYYGDIKLSFENQFLIRSWKGKNLEPMTSDLAVGSSVSKTQKESSSSPADAKSKDKAKDKDKTKDKPKDKTKAPASEKSSGY